MAADVQTVIIVGAGQAGAQAAISLRQGGHQGPLILLGNEPHPPYERPPLSKEFLAGKRTAAQLALRKPEFYAAQGIELRLGASITAIEKKRPRLLATRPIQTLFSTADSVMPDSGSAMVLARTV